MKKQLLNNKLSKLPDGLNKYKLLGLLVLSLCGLAKPGFADVRYPDYNLYSRYEFRIHFTGQKPAKSYVKPFVKVVNQNKSSYETVESSFSKDTLTIKGLTYTIPKLNPDTPSMPDVNYTVYIYGSQYNDYAKIVPIQVRISTNQLRALGDVDEQLPPTIDFILYPIGTYQQTIIYPEGTSVKVNPIMNEAFNGSTHKTKYYSGCHEMRDLSLGGITVDRQCEEPELTTVIDVELPYRTTQFVSTRQAKSQRVDFTNTWNGLPDD